MTSLAGSMERVQRLRKSSYARKGLANANGKWTYEPQPHCVARWLVPIFGVKWL
jgi:hypothetical protein